MATLPHSTSRHLSFSIACGPPRARERPGNPSRYRASPPGVQARRASPPARVVNALAQPKRGGDGNIWRRLPVTYPACQARSRHRARGTAKGVLCRGARSGVRGGRISAASVDQEEVAEPAGCPGARAVAAAGGALERRTINSPGSRITRRLDLSLPSSRSRSSSAAWRPTS
jgi:hypothetical protein